jgi:hypothetical protein
MFSKHVIATSKKGQLRNSFKKFMQCSDIKAAKVMSPLTWVV